MASISIEQPPENTDNRLTEYLNRMFQGVDTAVGKQQQYDVIYIVPAKPQVGSTYYFGAATGAITSEGWWGYKSTGWAQLG